MFSENKINQYFELPIAISRLLTFKSGFSLSLFLKRWGKLIKSEQEKLKETYLKEIFLCRIIGI